MPVEIAIRPNAALFIVRARLESAEYALKFDWNGRNDRYYLSVYQADGTLALAGIKVIANWPLLRKYAYPELPPGDLVVDDQLNDGAQPALGTLGDRFRLWYYARVELAGSGVNATLRRPKRLNL